jgi:hypothetical protein
VCEIVALIVVDVPPDCIVTPVGDPFHKIWALVVKLLPIAVNVKSLGDPAVAEVGLIELRTGVDPADVMMDNHELTRIVMSIVPRPVA